ncbi:unnamed protein product [Amoebophrya sp. A25]|nr:unnamed protein product [Amoebophrya sp. A25]|eukprot:GSA25T00025084001.1
MSLDMVGKVTRAKSRGARDMASVIMHLHDEEMKLKHEKVARTVIPSKKQVLEKEVDDFLERKLQSEIERKYIPGSPLAKQVIASTRSKAQIKPQGQPDQVFVGQTHNFTYVLDSHGHVLIDDDLRLVQPEDITFTQEGKIMVDRSAGNKAKAAAEEQSKKEGSDRQTQTSRRLSSKSEPNFRPLVRDAIEEISRDYHQTVEASVAKYGFVPSCYSEKNFQTRPINLAKTLDKEETRKKVNKQKIYDHTESLLFEATQEESDRRLELACWHAMNEKHRASIGSPIKLQPRHSPEFWQDLVDEKIGLLRSARFAYFVSRNPDLEAVKAIAPDWVERGEISDWDQYHFWLSRNADGSTKGYNQLVYEQGANNRGVHLKDHRHLLSAQIAQMKKDALVSRASALIDSDRRIANQSLEAAKYQKLLQRGGLLSSASPMRHQEFESMLGKFDNYGQGQMSVSFDEEGQVRSGIVSSDPPRKASKPPKKASSRKIEFGFAPLIRRKEGSAIVDEPPEGLLTGSHSSQERITYVDGQAVEERSSTYRFADDDAHHVVEDLLPDRLRKTAISTGHTSTKSVGAERPPSKKAVDAERLPSTKSAGAERPPLTKWAGAERPPATKSASAERPPSTKSASAERQILTKSIGVVNEVVGRRNGSVNGGAERGDTIEPGSASRGAVQGPTDDVDSGAIPQDGVDEEVPGIEARGGDQYEDAGASGDEDYTPRSDRNANDPTTEQRPGFGSAVYRMMAPRPGLEEDFPRERASSQRPPSYKLPSGVSGPGPVSGVYCRRINDTACYLTKHSSSLGGSALPLRKATRSAWSADCRYSSGRVNAGISYLPRKATRCKGIQEASDANSIFSDAD